VLLYKKTFFNTQKNLTSKPTICYYDFMNKFSVLSEKAQSVLKTLCSNYRGAPRVKAAFRCSVHFGLAKFLKKTTSQLDELKNANIILSYQITDEETDENADMCYFNVFADMNLSLEEMAEISANSQTVFMG